MILRYITTCILLVGLNSFVSAQNPIGNATLEQRLPLIEQLQIDQKFEEALHEFEDLLFYIKREKIQTTPPIIRIAKSVYISNQNQKALEDFLFENGLAYADGLSDDTKIALQKEIIYAYQAIGKEQIANDLEEELFLLYENRLRIQAEEEAVKLQKQGDSLRMLYSIAPPFSSNGIIVQKQKSIFLLLALGMCTLIAYLFYRNKVSKSSIDSDKYQAYNQNFEKQVNPKIYSDEETIKRIENEENGDFFGYFNIKDEFELNKVALIIESDSHTARYLRMVLSKRFQIEMASNISEAQESIHRLLPDVIFCSSQIGSSDGANYIRSLKMADLTMHVPVVLLSQDTETGHLDMERSKADCFIPKPTQGQVFYEKIEVIFRNKKAQHIDIQRIIQLWFSNSPIKSSTGFVNSLLNCIEKYMADSNFTPDVLARKFNMSNLQFYRKVVSTTGRTPSELIREMRLEKAKFMLEAGEMPKPIISQMVGYENEGIFSLAFRNHFGDTTLLA